MPILTLTSADAGLTIPISGTASWTVNGTDAADTFEIAAGTPTTITGGAGTDVIKFLGSNTDYTTLLSGSNVIFTHTATGRTATIPVTGTGDSVQFGNGTAVTLSGSTAANVMLGTQNITATSAAVTGATGTATGGGTTPTTPTFSVGASATSVTEGGSVTFTVSLTGPAQSAATTVAYTLAGTGGAALGTDTGTHVPAGNSGTLTFAAGEITKTVVVPVAFDSTTETGEGMTITLSAPSTGTVLSTSASAAAVAFADPTAPTFTITSNAVAGSATEEGQAITYTITPSSVTDKAYTFTLSTVGDTLSGVATAATATDFSPASKTVTFAAGTTAAQTVVQTIVDDGVTEGLEGYKTTLLNSSFAAVGTSLTGLITDNTVTGATFTLTTGLDTATSKSSVSGILSDTVAQETWSLTDTVSGTTATTDTMAVRIIGDANGLTTRTGLQTSAIEKISFSYTDANDAAESNSISAASFTGVTALAVTGSSNVNTTSTVRDTIAFTSVAAGVALEVSNNTSQTSVSYTGVGTATSGDSVTLNAAGGSTGVVTFADAAGDGFVTVNVATSGTASTIKSLAAGTDNTTVNVTGGSALTITDSLAGTVTTFDASTATGAVNVGVTGSTTTVAKGGTGTTDVLGLTLGSSVLTGAAISGFETVKLNASANGSAFALNLITGATAINVTSDGTANTLALSKAAAGQGLNFVGSGSSTAAQVFDTVNQTLTTSGTTDSIAIAINNGGTANALTTHTIGALNLLDYESATFTSADLAKATIGGVTLAAAATGITVNAATALDLGTIATAAALATFNAGGSAGAVSVNMGSSVAALTYTGSLGVDTVTNGVITSGVLQTYNLGTGNDLFTYADVAATGQIQLNGEAGDDSFTFATGVSLVTGNVIGINGGTGIDTVYNNTTTAGNFIDTWSGIEKMQDNSSQALDINVVTGYAETMEITTIDATGVTTFKAASDNSTISLANLTFTGAAFGAVTNLLLTSANGTNSLTGAATQATQITGGTGADAIIGGTGADVIIGGVGADVMTGGTGADNYKIGASTTVNQTSDSSVVSGTTGQAANHVLSHDKIVGYVTASDIITLTTAIINNNADAVATAGNAAITATVAAGDLNAGLATFHADDDTLAEQIIAVEASLQLLTATTAGGVAVWSNAGTGHSYLFVTDAVAGVGAGDLLIELTGVTGIATGITNTSSTVITAMA